MRFDPLRIFSFPVKGLGGQELKSSKILEGRGLPHDRALAFLFTDTHVSWDDSQVVPWVHKFHFAIQNDWEGLSRLSARWDSTSENLALFEGNEIVVQGKISPPELREPFEDFLNKFLAQLHPSKAAKHPALSPVKLVGDIQGSSRYPDRNSSHISVMNLASLRDLNSKLEIEIDIRRFRGNLLIDSGNPWEEMNWVGKEIRIGSTLIRIKGPIGRCHNINVHPELGIADFDLLSGLKKHFGHTIFGMVATVEKSGEVEAIGPA